ncbi:amino acid transporter [Hortaea werneckii]|nr:amino acid transporter [Hortaea werneckii]
MPTDNNLSQGNAGERAAVKDLGKGSVPTVTHLDSFAGDVEVNRYQEVSEDSRYGYEGRATRDIGILELVSVGWSICNSWISLDIDSSAEQMGKSSSGVGIIIPQILTAPIIHYNPAHVSKPWHIFLIYQAGSAACLLHNVFALRQSMWIFNLIFALSVATFFVATVTCLARAPGFQSNQSVWVTFFNRTGWESEGVVFLTGILSPGYMYAGLDGAIHLAEESKNPTTAVPRALLSTWIVGFLTSFVVAIACMYTAQDFDKIASTPTGFPIFELFRQAMRSDAASTVMLVVMLLAVFAALAGCQQTASRLTWAFARDRGLFGSSKLSHMDEKWLVPVWALCANAAVIFIIGCVYLGSSTAFNAFIGTGLILQLITFAIPAALLLLRRRSAQYLPKSRKFKVPAVIGWVANAGTVGFTVIVTIFWCLPTVFPVASSNMSKFAYLNILKD